MRKLDADMKHETPIRIDSLHKNIPLLFMIQTARWFLLVMPIIVLYFQDHGLRFSEIMIVQAAFSVSMLLFEIPSGYFSDKIGRKLTIIIGLFFSSFGMLLFAALPFFLGFIIAEIFLGLGASFVSGTDSSLLYDTLLSMRREDLHHQTESRYMAVGNFSEAAAGILGGFLAVQSMRLTFFIEAIVLLVAALTALALSEPPIDREGKKALSPLIFLSDLKTVLHNWHTTYFILFGAFSGLGTFLLVWYVQPILNERGLPLMFFGLVWAGLNLLVGLSSIVSNQLGLQKHPRLLFLLLPFSLSLCYLLLPLYRGLWILPGFFGFYIIRGIQGPFLRNAVHRITNSQHRATVLSTQSLVLRLLFTALGPLYGALADGKGINAAFIAIGASYAVLALINLAVTKKAAEVLL